MEQLLKQTTAYKIFCGDGECGKLSHAYMLYFADEVNLRSALKLFARRFFSGDKPSLIESESLTDLKIYPEKDKKLTVEVASQIVADGAIRPVAHDKKLFIISSFNQAAPVFQNKLLKILEEPPEGVYFLLGVTSVSSVLDTVMSRVKLLEIPPFTEEQIFSALQRESINPDNRLAAQSCGGILGEAQNLLKGDWYEKVRSAAQEICDSTTLASATYSAVKWGDFKYKKELLSEMQRRYFAVVKGAASSGETSGKISVSTAIYAIECINKALLDIKFNANFSSLLYDLLIGIVQHEEKGKKIHG
ncbi:MAG: hypothetical protein ACI4MN_05095 [Candidatus Coproplasma sp.]